MLSWSAFFNTIILLGTVQGFIVSFLLFFQAKRIQANRILAVLIFLISLACFNLCGNYADWFHSSLLRFVTVLIPLVVIMPFGPLIYFYVQSTLDPDFKFTKKARKHFYTVIIDLIPSFTVLIYIVGLLTHVTKHDDGSWGKFIDDYNVYADIPRWLSVTFYVGVSAKYLADFKTKYPLSGIITSLHFRWLQQFIRVFMVFQVLWLAYLIPYVIPRYTNFILDTFDWYPIYVPMAFLIYWLGIKGYSISQHQMLVDKKSQSPGTSLSPEIVEQVVAAISKAMEKDRLYLNPNLNLALMSEKTGFPQKTISAVLNQHLQKSFNEFVNSFRIDEFKLKIFQPEMNHLTIAGIALECGFNSQATFQRTFKEVTGKSPSEFRKAALTPQ